jgi:predicted transcriptional regulator
MGGTNILLSVVEILDLLNNVETLNKHDLANYVSLDLDMTRDFVKFLKNRRMINIDKDTGNLCIKDEGRKFLNTIKSLTESIT